MNKDEILEKTIISLTKLTKRDLLGVLNYSNQLYNIDELKKELNLKDVKR